jgi:hypothetical protein
MREPIVIVLSGFGSGWSKPIMSSFPNTEVRQCESAVPSPPVFSTGTAARGPSNAL